MDVNKNKALKSFVSTISFLLITILCFSQRKFYVAANGSNVTFAQAQNINTPWQTIAQVLAQWNNFTNNDSILFRRGDTFVVPAGGFNITKGGGVGAPINVGAYGTGARPIFDGFTTITTGQWTSIGGGLYTASVLSGQAAWGNLLFDGNFQPISQYPRAYNQYMNVSSATPGPAGCACFIGGGGQGTITSTATSLNNTVAIGTIPGGESGIAPPMELYYRSMHWVLWKAPVVSMNTTTHTVTFAPVNSTSGGNIYSPAYINFGYGFFFQNHPNLCTQLGDWAYNTATHVLTVFFGGGGPAGHTVRFNTVSNLVSSGTFGNVSFSNIDFQGGYTNVIFLTNAANISIINCNVRYGGVYGVFANGTSTGLNIQNSKIEWNNSVGIQCLAGGATAQNFINDTIQNNGMVRGMGGSGEGQYVGVEDVKGAATVKNCIIKKSGYHALTYKAGAQIINNFVDSFCIIKDDGGGIYNGGASIAGSLVSGNIIGDGIGLPQGTPDPEFRAEGIYNDDQSSNGNFQNNTVFNVGDAGVFNHASGNMTYNGTTVFNATTGAIRFFNNSNTTTNVTSTNNIWFALQAASWCMRSSSGTTEPRLFFGTLNNNFYCRPIAETQTISQIAPTVQNFTLAAWKTWSGKDAASVVTPWTITATNQVRFEYNASNSNRTISLGQNYVDVKNVTYPGTITLAPWTSVIMKATGGAPPPLSATVTIAQNPVTCATSTTSATVNATGGQPPYTYRIGSGSFTSTNVFPNLGIGSYTFQVQDAALTVVSVNATVTGPTQIVITESNPPITVNGGLVDFTITATGGNTGGYTYSLDGVNFQASNVFTSKGAGTYTVTVKDSKGCTNTLTFTVTQPAVLTFTATAAVNPLVCNGNTTSITGVASGGTTPYQYNINGGAYQAGATFSGLVAGTYTLTVKDAAGVVKTATVTITQPAALTLSETHLPISVNGGVTTVQFTANGGTPSYTYSMNGTTFQSSNIFNNVTAGNYTAFVRDANGCTTMFSFTITQPTALTVSAAVTTPIACNAGTGVVTVTASNGTPPYQYRVGTTNPFQSLNTFSLTAGTYQFFVQDAGGALVSTTLTITQPAAMAMSLAYTSAPTNVVVTVTGGTPPYSYQLDGGKPQTGNTFSSVGAGNHAVVVTDANGCTSQQTFNVGAALGVTLTVGTIPCNGGSATATASGVGGNTPYTFLWSDNVTTASRSITAGTWSVRVTDNVGHIKDTTFVLTQPAAISMSLIFGSAPTTLTINSSGGSGTLTYSLDGSAFQPSNTFSNVGAGNHTAVTKDANGCQVSQQFNVGSGLGVSLSVASIACNGGSALATASGVGGTAPYTFLWSNGVTTASQNITAGTWSVRVTDAVSHIKDTTFVLTQPSAITMSLAYSIAPTTLTVTASGGVGALQYSLDGSAFQSSNTFTNVSAGNHTIVVRDVNLCQLSQQFNVAAPALGVTLTVGTIACNGGTAPATVQGTGGTTPYNYLWSNNQTTQSQNLIAGTWTVRVTDAANRIKDTTFVLNQPAQMTITPILGTITINGGSTTAQFNVSGGTGTKQYSLNGVTYQASNLFSGLTAGNYTVWVKDANNCIQTQNFTLSQPGVLIIGIARGSAPLCYGGTQAITVSGSGGTGPYTGTGTFTQSAGTVHYSITDAFGATADTFILVSTPAQIVVTVNAGTISVNGGSTTVVSSAVGGTGSLLFSLDGGTYQVSGTFTGVLAGTHRITVKDANNCTNFNDFTITQPGVLLISVSITTNPLLCYNDQTPYTFSASGGTAPLTLNRAASGNLSAGTYLFRVTDALGATHDSIITIIQPSLIGLLQIIQYPNPIATFGGTADSVMIENSGGTPINDSVYQYSLDGGGFVQSDSAFKYILTGVTGGAHQITIKDANGCQATYPFNVVEPPPPAQYQIRRSKIYKQILP